MSQCVPSWDLDDNSLPTPPPRLSLRSHSNSTAPDVSTMSEYEVAELTWENGQVATHGLGLPRKPSSWDKPRATGTLESIVNQATTKTIPHFSTSTLKDSGASNKLVAWFDSVANSGAPSNMDALVPAGVRGSSGIFNGSSTRVGSCSADTVGRQMAAVSAARVSSTPEWSSRGSPSVSGSATFGLESTQLTLDSTKGSDPDSICQLQKETSEEEEEKKKRCNGKSSVSTKRSRAAAIHNQSERKRRDKINQRMKTLQKMVPNSSKTDKASMLEEVIEYMKQIQAQVQVISRMNMMLPLAMQQHLQMSTMMASRNMGMGIGMGMEMGMPGIGMDMNNIGGRLNVPGIIPPVLNPTAFMAGPMTSWDAATGGASSAAAIPDPLSAYLACQAQPMNMEAYSMMAAMYQQVHQPPAPSKSKNKD